MRVIVLVVVILAGTWIAIGLRNKAAYDAFLNETAKTATITSVDEQDVRRLNEMEGSWLASEETTNGISQTLALAGMAPTVWSVVQVLTSTPPAYCWWPPSRNYRATALAGTRSAYSELAGDQAIRVSQDGRVAVLWLGTNRALVFRDTPTGLRETWFKRKRQ
jgi:hypothetical protein